MTLSAPRPSNWRELVDAWNNPAEFARLCDQYYSQVGAERAAGAVDVTAPRRSAVDG